MSDSGMFCGKLSVLNCQLSDINDRMAELRSEPIYDELAMRRLQRAQNKVRSELVYWQRKSLPDIIA